jgi:uncharacterized protein (TIGR00255 family)
MIRSMTGFGRAEGVLSDRYRSDVVVRSVNHRHLEISIRLRDDFAFLESPLRRRVGTVCRRGKVDLSIRVRSAAASRSVSFDPDALELSWNSLARVCSERNLPPPNSVQAILGLPGLLAEPEAGELLEEGERNALEALVDSALARLDTERAREGAALAAVLAELRERLGERLELLLSKRASWLEASAEALRGRVRELTAGAGVDPGRMEQEIAILADRTDVTEELDRLVIHLRRLDELLGAAAPGSKEAGIGRGLDFLAQELTREVGTCGAKLRHPDATGIVLEMKGLVEKIREQAQNVE